MGSHYQVLRLQPEKDFEGKSESDVIKKIEVNYQSLLARVPQMYSSAEAREKALKELEAAKSVLSDPKLRKEYDHQLKTREEMAEKQKVTIEFIALSDAVIQEIDDEIQKEEDKK